MQPRPTDPQPSSSARRRFDRLDLLLLGVVLLAAIPRLYFGATQFVEYDGYWHVFVAQQDRWRNFIWDCQQLDHPPLYVFLLRWTLWLGTSHLAYRAIPILAGLASVAALGRIASKMMRSTLSPALVALAFALALPAIVISCEVRAYMLAVVFVLIAYTFFLDAIDREGPAGSLRPRVLFVLSAVLACLTEYYAVFFVCAVFGIGMVVPLLRRREPLWKAWAREAATFAAVVAAVLWPYITELSRRAVLKGHLLAYYYDATGQESLGAFLLRNLQNAFDLFSPWPAPSRDAFLAIAGGLLLAVCGALWLVRRIGEPKNLAAAATVAATLLILVQLMVAAVVRIYPFGGLMRQQFLLFPFLVLCAFVLPDRLAAAIPRRAAHALAGFLALAITAVSYWQFDAYPKVTETLMTGQMQRFNGLFPSPGAVYLDQYNLIAFFMHHDDWKWKFAGRVDSVPDVDIYRLSRGTAQMLVFRDKGRWLADSLDPMLDRNLAECLRSRGLPDIVLFRLAQNEEPWEVSELKAYRQSISEIATTQGLCVQGLSIHDRDVYAQFRLGGCAAPPQQLDPLAQATGSGSAGNPPGRAGLRDRRQVRNTASSVPQNAPRVRNAPSQKDQGEYRNTTRLSPAGTTTPRSAPSTS